MSFPRPKAILTFCFVEHIRLKIFARRRRAGEILLTPIWKTHDAETNHLENSYSKNPELEKTKRNRWQ